MTTSNEGSYTIPQLPVGGYVVIVTATNFQTTTLENIEVTAGGTVRVDAQLAIGGLKDAVTVTADARQIQTDSVKVTTAISSKFIQDLPLVVGGQLRSPLDLSLIAPEAKAGTSGDGAPRQHRHRRRPGRRLGPDASTACRRRPARRSSSGCGRRSTPRRSKRSPSSPSTRNGFKAEFGHAGGGAVSFVSRSGSNNWHGKAFEFFRHDTLDTINYFSKALGRPKPPLEQHDFGGVFGGPVDAAEAVQRPQPDVLLRARTRHTGTRPPRRPPIVTIPTAEMYTGDFSAVARRQRQSHSHLRPGDHTRQSERARVHPRSVSRKPGSRSTRFSQISRNVLQLATMRPDLPGVRNNFVYTSGRHHQHEPLEQVQPQARSQPLGQGSARDSCSTGARCWWCRRAAGRPAGCRCPLNNFRDEDSHTYVFRANWDRVITPTLLNRVTFGHNNWWQLRASFNRDQGWGTQIGLKNVPGPELLFPLIDFSNDYLDWGRSEWGGSGNYLWALTDDLTWVKAKHTWKTGFIFQEDHYDGYGWHTAAGTYNFNRGATAGFLPNGTLDSTGATGNAFASVPARRGAVVRDHDQPLRVRSVALLLRLRAGRLAHEQQAHPQLRRALRVHAADLGRPLP